MHTRPTEDEYFCLMAFLASTRSLDPSTKVGAVLVKDGRVISTGYNGFPPGIEDDGRLMVRDMKYPRIVHAEMNALLYAGIPLGGTTLYVYAYQSPPCHECAKNILGAKVKRYVSCGPVRPERWNDSMEIARNMFEEAGVEYVELDVDFKRFLEYE